METTTQAEGRDQRLAGVLADLTEQARRGRPPDWPAVAAQYPDLADELRQLWPAVQLADEFARSSGAPPTRASRERQRPESLAITRFWRSWAAAAWASFTGRGRRAWTAPSPSR
jgi:hypothetical protein